MMKAMSFLSFSWMETWIVTYYVNLSNEEEFSLNEAKKKKSTTTLLILRINDSLDFHNQSHRVGQSHHKQPLLIPTMQKPSWLKTTLPPPPPLKIASRWMKNELRQAHKKGRWVKPHFPFFHLSPGNESPDNTHTFGRGNWKAPPVWLQDARPYWIWEKGPQTPLRLI